MEKEILELMKKIKDGVVELEAELEQLKLENKTKTGVMQVQNLLETERKTGEINAYKEILLVMKMRGFAK